MILAGLCLFFCVDGLMECVYGKYTLTVSCDAVTHHTLPVHERDLRCHP